MILHIRIISIVIITVVTKISITAQSSEPSLKETINYIEQSINKNYIQKRIKEYTCRPYFSYTKSFELEFNNSNQLVIKAKVYTTHFKKTETNTFKLNLRDVKITHMSDVALMFNPIKSKKSIKMIDGNACVERLLDWNAYHHQLALNVYDSEFTSDEQSKLYNAFKYLQERSLSKEVEQENDSDFFSSKNYNNRNKLNGPNAATIPLISNNGVYQMDVTINKKTYRGILDSGASTFLISKDMIIELLESGFLDRSHFVDMTSYEVADGSTVVGLNLILPKLEIGGFMLFDIEATIVDGQTSTILIGQSILKRFSSWEVDRTVNKLIIQK